MISTQGNNTILFVGHIVSIFPLENFADSTYCIEVPVEDNNHFEETKHYSYHLSLIGSVFTNILHSSVLSISILDNDGKLH